MDGDTAIALEADEAIKVGRASTPCTHEYSEPSVASATARVPDAPMSRKRILAHLRPPPHQLCSGDGMSPGKLAPPRRRPPCSRRDRRRVVSPTAVAAPSSVVGCAPSCGWPPQ